MASARPWIICKSCFSRLHLLTNCQKNLPQVSYALSRCYSNGITSGSSQADKRNKPTAKAVTISKSMRAYMKRVQEHDDLMNAEVADYEIGKRHLANIMGEDPDSFTQQDVDRAIEYLLPSGLFDKKARPMLKNPYEIFPKRKAAQFGLDGRPYHWMYFTTLPNYYALLYEITWKLEDLKSVEDQLRSEGKLSEQEKKRLNLGGSNWISQTALKDRLLETLPDKEYNHLIVMLERLSSHPLALREQEFIMDWRVKMSHGSLDISVPEVQEDVDGRCFVTTTGRRKNCKATVKLYKPGTGTFSINATDLRFFSNFLHRETLLLPLTLAQLIGQVDVVAHTEGGGPTGQAGAIRYAMSHALTAFVSEEVREQMRLAGLLTKDPRTRERKKVGQEGSRRKFTWKKR